MALSITNIGSGSVVTTSTFTVRAPPGGIPAGSVIFAIIQDGAKAAGTITDNVGNPYTQITAVAADTLFAWFTGNALALDRGHGVITYAQNTINAGAQGTFCYITGTPPTHFLDTLVTVSASGGFSTQPSLLTSGTPVIAGEAFIAAAAAVFTGVSVGTYNQDAGHGWASPPNPITLIPIGGTQTFSLGAGSQVNPAATSRQYQPTFSLVPTTWASFIIALTSAPVSNVSLAGAGSLSVNALPPFQLGTARFTGSGSLVVASATLNIADGAKFDGAGTLNSFGFLPSTNGARFVGSGSLSVNLIKAIGAELDGAGSLVASASVGVAGTAVFAGTGSLSVQPSGLAGGVQFRGSGNLAATIALGKIASAEFDGVGSLASIASLRTQIVAKFDGAGMLSTDTNRIAFGSIVFGGTGNLTLFATFNVAGLAAFGGAGSLTAVPSSTSSNAIVLSGAGDLSANTSQGVAGLVQFNGSGSLNASVAFANVAGFVTFSGAGGLTIGAFGAIFDSATFNGVGSLAAIADIGLGAITSVFAGVGTLRVAQVFGAVNASAQFNGTGQLVLPFNVLFTIPTFTGSGSLRADTMQVNVLNTVHAGLGALGQFPLGQEQSLSPLYASFAVFGGAGGMSADFIHHNATINAVFNGTGRMCVWAEVWIGVAGQTTLELCPGPGPTENVVA